jgi:hypothetical protein
MQYEVDTEGVVQEKVERKGHHLQGKWDYLLQVNLDN